MWNMLRNIYVNERKECQKDFFSKTHSVCKYIKGVSIQARQGLYIIFLIKLIKKVYIL